MKNIALFIVSFLIVAALLIAGELKDFKSNYPDHKAYQNASLSPEYYKKELSR